MGLRTRPERGDRGSSGASRARAPRRGVRARLIGLVTVAVLLASGCGARWDDDQRAAVAARYAGSGGATDGSAAAAADPSAAAADAETSTTASGGSAGGTQAGSGGGGAGTPAAGAKPCAATSKAPGVTDDSIAVGTISSLSGPVPGIGASAAAAARSYVAYLNANGGVCGRKIVLQEADDGTDNGRYRAVVSELGPKVLGLVGGFGAG